MPPACTNSIISLIGFPRPPVGPHLHHTLRALGGLHHVPAFGNRQTERLLDIHVLTGVAGVDEHGRVPVVGRSDDHRVDLFVRQQLLVLFIFLRSGARLLDGKLHVVVAQIADGGGDLVAVFEESVVDLIATIAESDVTHPDPVIGSQNAGVTGGGSRKAAARAKSRRVITPYSTKPTPPIRLTPAVTPAKGLWTSTAT